ncbi:Histidine kinase-, DNA gyrase B-, and HSP90-like ATPase [Sulfitobacter brevis]|uniref:histidine kinase n=1 Tax=Sulfitobacter brevis TaxID=74348 RepID=A0A1I2HMP5_9RHOB|nr:ATP-binding protein [Sulfitobacter brevis]SFF29681.1 Histidine kinase-, DNA gyrase B-, and HSP90-like ATPase [Sulfitobacter brevis]
MKFNLQVIDLSAALNHSIETNQSYADSYSVEIFADSIEPNVKISADPARLDQLMANLLSNAIKFSKEGDKVQIDLTTKTGRAIVAVTDHGRGIPQKDKLRIFERFQQVDSSDKRERGGTGLGLSIAKAIAEAHQAELTVESVLGKGSTFYISFPLIVGS